MFKRLFLVLLLIFIINVVFTATAFAASNSSCYANLIPKIESNIKTPQFERSRWGILIEALKRQEVIYSLEAQSYFTPASNAKLLTSAAVLNELGPDFRFITPIYATGNPPNLSSLRLIGVGDPTIKGDHLKTLAKQIKGLGVKRILELIVEEPREPIINPSWEWEDVYGHWGTAVNKLILNENSFRFVVSPQTQGKPLKLSWDDKIAMSQWRLDNQGVTGVMGSDNTVEINGDLGKPTLRVKGELAADAGDDVWHLALMNPADYFLQNLRAAMFEQGITVLKAKVVNKKSTPADKPLAVIQSPPLSKMLEQINQESNNLYAETLVRTLAPSEKQRFKVIQDNLTRLGVDQSSYLLDDASGLSRKNFVSPEALVKVLKAMANSKDYQVYRHSLAQASLKGTLKYRFQNTPIAGKLSGKTGFVTGVNSISGYLEIPGYDTLVFSIILNQSRQKYREVSAVIDKMLLALMDLGKC